MYELAAHFKSKVNPGLLQRRVWLTESVVGGSGAECQKDKLDWIAHV